MRKLLDRKMYLFIALVGGLSALFFLITPVMAAELTPEQKIAKAVQLAADAQTKAAEALKTGNLALAQEAQAMADEAAGLISEVTALAADTGNTDLAQQAYNASVNLGTAINLVIEAADNIAATSTDPDTVAAANALKAAATTTQATNLANQGTLVAAGAVPGEAEAYEESDPDKKNDSNNPTDDEPPIGDTNPGSQV